MKNNEKKESGFLNLIINVLIPTAVLMKFSDEKYLGTFYALIIALAFPLLYGGFDLIKNKKYNFFSILGLIAILLTGGIVLLELNRDWMIAKEVAIPLIMGLAVIISHKTKYPVLKLFLSQVLDFDKISNKYKECDKEEEFNNNINVSTYLFSATFFVSAILNYIVAVLILVGEPGTQEFNQSLGKMNFLSFFVIGLPMTIMTVLIIYYLLNKIKKTTGMEMEEIFKI